MEKPKPPEALFDVRGVSFWPFDARRTTGPWSQRKDADVYGNVPSWARRLMRVGRD